MNGKNMLTPTRLSGQYYKVKDSDGSLVVLPKEQVKMGTGDPNFFCQHTYDGQGSNNKSMSDSLEAYYGREMLRRTDYTRCFHQDAKLREHWRVLNELDKNPSFDVVNLEEIVQIVNSTEEQHITLMAWERTFDVSYQWTLAPLLIINMDDAVEYESVRFTGLTVACPYLRVEMGLIKCSATVTVSLGTSVATNVPVSVALNSEIVSIERMTAGKNQFFFDIKVDYTLNGLNRIELFVDGEPTTLFIDSTNVTLVYEKTIDPGLEGDINGINDADDEGAGNGIGIGSLIAIIVCIIVGIAGIIFVVMLLKKGQSIKKWWRLRKIRRRRNATLKKQEEEKMMKELEEEEKSYMSLNEPNKKRGIILNNDEEVDFSNI